MLNRYTIVWNEFISFIPLEIHVVQCLLILDLKRNRVKFLPCFITVNETWAITTNRRPSSSSNSGFDRVNWRQRRPGKVC